MPLQMYYSKSFYFLFNINKQQKDIMIHCRCFFIDDTSQHKYIFVTYGVSRNIEWCLYVDLCQ